MVRIVLEERGSASSQLRKNEAVPRPSAGRTRQRLVTAQEDEAQGLTYRFAPTYRVHLGTGRHAQ
ncbi:hypothetical protein B296_00051081, partial [Ensete ventricosum]